jgi:hypothetical protein
MYEHKILENFFKKIEQKFAVKFNMFSGCCVHLQKETRKLKYVFPNFCRFRSIEAYGIKRNL